MTTSNRQQTAMTELWAIVLRHRWRFILPAFAVAACVLLGGLALPRKYRASALFERRSDLVLLEMTSRGATRSFQEPRSSLNEEIAGRPAIEQVMRTLGPRLAAQGLVTSEAQRRALRQALINRVVVQCEIATHERDRVRVEFVGLDPQIATQAVNALIDNYISRTRQEMESKLTRSAAFFEDKVASHRLEIERLENQLLTFEIEHAELLPDTPNNLQAQLASVQESLSDAQGQRDAVALRIVALQKALDEAPRMIPTVVTARNPELLAIEKQLVDLRKQLYHYTATLKMTQAHPDVVAARMQIADLEHRLLTVDAEVVTQRQTTQNPRRSDMELELAAARSEHRAYSDQVEALKQQIQAMSATGEELFAARSRHRKLSRDLGEQTRQLAFWEDNLRRIDMALAAESGNRGVRFDFIQPAEASPRPVSPNLAQVIVAAILLAGAAGSLGVFLAHRSDDLFTAGDELARQMGLPLFGSVSEIISRQQRRLRTLQRAVLYPAAGVSMAAVLIGAAGLLYVDLEHPHLLDQWKARVRLLAERPAQPGADHVAADLTPTAPTAPTTSTPSTPAPAIHAADADAPAARLSIAIPQ